MSNLKDFVYLIGVCVIILGIELFSILRHAINFIEVVRV